MVAGNTLEVTELALDIRYQFLQVSQSQETHEFENQNLVKEKK
jgi:hypothetical protein